MKKILLLLFVFTYIKTQAQIINSGFETWAPDFLAPTSMQPNTGNNSTGWWTYNMYNAAILGGSPISAFRSTNAHSGSYAAQITSVVYTPASHSINAPWGTPFIGHPYLDTLGILFTGTTNETSGTYTPGIPFSQKIGTLSFWYQYAPQGNDTAECRALLLTGNTPQGGGSIKIFAPTGTTWQQAHIPFFYIDSQIPDTLFILFSASSLDHTPIPGSSIWIDDITVSLLTGIEENTSSSFVVYPNPSNGIFNLETNHTWGSNTQVEIRNVLGACVYKSAKPEVGKHINFTLSLPDGFYFITLKTPEISLTQKIQIIKQQ